MSVETVRSWVCDAFGCGIRAPEGTDEWFNGIYTHGCPKHAAMVAEHKAKIDSSTCGRGSRARTYWYLTCACGWVPSPRWVTWNADPLREQHLIHLSATEASGGAGEAQEG